MNGGQQVCHGCQQSIEDEYRLHVAPDLNWHVACLLCSECHTPLSERTTCVIRDGQPYCRTDYIRWGTAHVVGGPVGEAWYLYVYTFSAFTDVSFIHQVLGNLLPGSAHIHTLLP